MSISNIKEVHKIKSVRDSNLDIFISLKNEYVYFMVCKAASSTVTYHLQFAEYVGTKFSVRNVNDVLSSPLILPFQFKEREFVDILNSKRYRKITFVRNPYSRLLSCYLHRIIGEKTMNPSKRVLYANSSFSRIRQPTFKDFVSFVADQDPIEMERHWKVQYYAVMYPMIEFDFIGKQETLDSDLLRAEGLIYGKPMFDHKSLKSLNLSPQQTNAKSKIHEYYTDSLMAKVVTCYEKDFEVFGYDQELP